jgi:hypothetical protein
VAIAAIGYSTGMNTRQKGDVAEGMVLAVLIRKGYVVSLPFGGSQRYDMVVEKDGKLLKVQCKMGRLRQGGVSFSVCSVNGFTGKSTDYHGDVDVFLVFCPDNNETYWVPVGIVGRKATKLRVLETKNGQEKNVKWAKDYKIDC